MKSYQLALLVALQIGLSALSGSELPINEEFPIWGKDIPNYLAHENAESYTEYTKDLRRHDRIYVDVTEPTLTILPSYHPSSHKTAVIICPGGGYRQLSMDNEGFQVAYWLGNSGLTSALLKYRLQPYDTTDDTFPPLNDLHQAIRLLRQHAEELGIEKVGVIGFSAGGNLAIRSGLEYPRQDPESDNPLEHYSARPDFIISVYPRISDDFVEKLHADFPPLFTTITQEDSTTPCPELLDFIRECTLDGLSVESHIFPDGWHGFGLGISNVRTRQWPAICESWIKDYAALKKFTPTITKPIPEDTKLHLRINCGARADLQDDDGFIWKSDLRFLKGRSRTATKYGIEFTGPAPHILYATERFGTGGYRVPVPNGQYSVRFHMMENAQGITAGKRVNTILLEGKECIRSVDAFAESGNRYHAGIVHEASTEVIDGELDIDFKCIVRYPLIQAIEIIAQ